MGPPARQRGIRVQKQREEEPAGEHPLPTSLHGTNNELPLHTSVTRGTGRDGASDMRQQRSFEAPLKRMHERATPEKKLLQRGHVAQQLLPHSHWMRRKDKKPSHSLKTETSEYLSNDVKPPKPGHVYLRVKSAQPGNVYLRFTFSRPC